MNNDIGSETATPRVAWDQPDGNALVFPRDGELNRPATVNPDASDIPFEERPPREAIIDAELERVLRSMNSGDEPTAAIEMDLRAALHFAQQYARDHKTAEEEYILAALRLLIERHLWGPRFFDEISATVSGDADAGSYDTALSLVNEFRVTQRLPYGGDVSARFLARATEDLRTRVSGSDNQSADIILSTNVPLLRGAGLAAREPRIQAERNLIYAARRFERFRRQFLVDVATEFLNLVVQQKRITNAENQLKRLIENLDRANDLVRAGRSDAFEAGRAGQQLLFAQDSLASQRENYNLAVDRFKVRIGMPVDQAVVILQSSLGLPIPETDIEQAVRTALSYRLDLQTERDRLDDSQRQIDLAKNDLLPDLDFFGSATIPTNPDEERSGLDFRPDDNAFSAGVTFGLPLDREIERIQLRQAQIAAARSERDYEEFRDNIVVTVRDSVREIDRAIFSLRIQEDNVRTARLRVESIDRAPDRATAQDRADAADDLTQAEDDRDRAVRDLEVAILQYLLNTGVLRVARDGTIEPLDGMAISRDSDAEGDNNDGGAIGG